MEDIHGEKAKKISSKWIEQTREYFRDFLDKTPHRKKMIAFMNKPNHKKIYRERSYKVEPMQGLVKDIFDLDRCWVRGSKNNRWLFAAMGLTVQMHQLEAFKQGRSIWNVKELVLG